MNRFFPTPAVAALAAFLALASSCDTAQAARGPDPTERVNVIYQESELCSFGCTGTRGWLDGDRVSDLRLQEAIFIISHYVPELADILAINLSAGTWLTVAEPDAPGAAADYTGSRQRIRISPAIAGGDMITLVAIVAHELVHGAQDRTVSACEREVQAYAWTALVWERLQSVSDSQATSFDLVARAWHEGNLAELVASWPLYWDVCGVAK
jgi:hypothetical protein